jgi:phosphoribosyl 1,2-cyclic phosphodiesterase
LRLASLGSGSEGNALLVECRDASRVVRILVDCGFGIREARRRLELLGLGPGDLDAILVTHEHSDHIGGAYRLASSADIPLHLTYGSLKAVPPAPALKPQWQLIDPGRAFEINGVRIYPFAVPHDAREPVQFVFDDGVRRLGVVTDLGFPSPHVIRSLDQLDALVLECNHDSQMLERSDYPWTLKKRISGDYGHLSNDASACLLAGIDQTRLKHVMAAHLSRQNNRPELAKAALAGAWGASPEAIGIIDQDTGLSWVDID